MNDLISKVGIELLGQLKMCFLGHPIHHCQLPHELIFSPTKEKYSAFVSAAAAAANERLLEWTISAYWCLVPNPIEQGLMTGKVLAENQTMTVNLSQQIYF